jgi:hypothetical protein
MSDSSQQSADAEYASLRSEILQWQQIRITVLGFALAVVGAVAISESVKSAPWIAAELMLAVILASAWLTWYATQGVLLIAAYIIVFHEEPRGSQGWESRLRTIKLPEHFKLSRILGFTYAILSIFSMLPLTGFSFQGTHSLINVPTGHQVVVCGLFVLSVGFSLFSVLSVKKYQLTTYRAHWEEVKRRETEAKQIAIKTS